MSRRRDFGSIDVIERGRRYRVRYWADKHDGKGYRRCSEMVRGTRRDADMLLARRQIEHGTDAPTPTLGRAYEMWWLPEMEDRLSHGELARSTFLNYISRWERHVRPAFGDVPVTDIRPLAVQGWLLGLTKSMADVSLIVLRQVLALCVRYDVLDRNVAKETYRMPTAGRTCAKDVWTLGEVCHALDVLRGTPAYLAAVLCAVGSCRVGESLGPRVDLGEVRSVDVGGMTVAVVDIRRSVDLSGGVSADGALKNRQSVRPVVIPEPWSLDVLAAPGPWLCGDDAPMSQLQARRAYERAMRSSGMEPIPMRNLRNSWRTYMRWELGVPEDMLERMMGHAGRNVGEVHYDRPRAEVFARVVADAWLRHRAGQSG